MSTLYLKYEFQNLQLKVSEKSIPLGKSLKTSNCCFHANIMNREEQRLLKRE